tara:strand:+ start:186 stop:689 length:504 start_codon:yes stop_codon:yes gene_type:complete
MAHIQRLDREASGQFAALDLEEEEDQIMIDLREDHSVDISRDDDDEKEEVEEIDQKVGDVEPEEDLLSSDEPSREWSPRSPLSDAPLGFPPTADLGDLEGGGGGNAGNRARRVSQIHEVMNPLSPHESPEGEREGGGGSSAAATAAAAATRGRGSHSVELQSPTRRV